MLKVSYHNHTNYSDGIDTPDAIAHAAYDAGYTHFAFTDHVYSTDYAKGTINPEDYKKYTDHINRLKEMYQGKMQIITGIEADWYKGKNTRDSKYEIVAPMIDFTVGSVHVLSPNGVDYLIDGPVALYEDCLHAGYNGDAQAMVTDYFETYTEMTNELKPDLLGHIDIIRKNDPQAKYCDESQAWYIALQENLAKLIAQLGLITEVNGGGAYRYKNDIYYPSAQFLRILKENNVKMTIGLDSHSVPMVDGYYQDSLNLLKKAGYRSLYYYDDNNWKEADIKMF